MSEESIRPALSPKEWENGACHRGETPVSATGSGVFIGTVDYFTPCGDGEEYPIGADYVFAGRERHALAALALDGEPFGFTWSMVHALHFAARHLRRTPNDWIDAAAEVDAAADRIAALLPPEEP